MVFKKALILGLGKSGLSAAKLARKIGYEVTVIDESDNDSLCNQKCELQQCGAEVLLGFKGKEFPLSTLIITSPGVGPKSNLGKMAAKTGAPIVSETEFAWTNCTVPIIAITGTNGKTTATEFCTHVLSNLGMKAIAAGNIGYPLSEVILSGNTYDYIVLEVSSFQLHYCSDFAPHAAMILNIESDHINWHGSFEHYMEDKLKIFKNQTAKDCLIINRNLADMVKNPNGKLITFCNEYYSSGYSLSENFILKDGKNLCAFDELGVMGKTVHNLENAMAVIGCCEFLGFPVKDIIKASLGFKLGEHRLEVVLEKDGILFINDSKSTNPLSMMAALKAVGTSKNVCLIAGGLDKDMDFSSILEHKELIKKIFIIGKSRSKLEKLFCQVLNYSSCLTFEEAVYSACDCAERGDVVLLSPGFASMDMFKNYIERGNVFKSLIKRRYLDERGRQKN